MSTVWTTGWEALPANLSSPSLGPAYIRGLKTAIHERMWNEHGTYSNANSGADGSPGKDWVHKAGSAVAYFVTSTPTKRPDASTAFTTSDTGRVWVNSTSRAVKALSGTAFVPVSGHEYHKFLNGKFFVTSIGGWNLNADSDKIKILRFSSYPFLSSVRVIDWSVIIQSDGGNGWFRSPLPSSVFLTDFHIDNNYVAIDAVQARMNVGMTRNYRVASTSFPKGKYFSNTTINRGWVVIEYV